MTASEAYEWQKTRRKKGGSFAFPAKGFGADGVITLWLPDPAPSRRVKFIDGEPKFVLDEGVMSDPKIAALRDETILSARDFGAVGVLSISVSFMRFAAAIICQSYNVTDDDLSLLLDGNRWHNDIAVYLVGGHEAARRLASHQLPTAPPIAYEFEEETPVPPRRRWWQFWR